MENKKNKKKIKLKEKFMIFLIVVMGIFVPVSIVYSQATLSNSNFEVEAMKNKVSWQENANESLSMQVDELASLSNIQDIAKEYGLSYNNDNIIVIGE